MKRVIKAVTDDQQEYLSDLEQLVREGLKLAERLNGLAETDKQATSSGMMKRKLEAISDCIVDYYSLD